MRLLERATLADPDPMGDHDTKVWNFDEVLDATDVPVDIPMVFIRSPKKARYNRVIVMGRGSTTPAALISVYAGTLRQVARVKTEVCAVRKTSNGIFMNTVNLGVWRLMQGAPTLKVCDADNRTPLDATVMIDRDDIVMLTSTGDEWVLVHHPA